MLRGRAGAPALVPPADPVGVTPLIEVGDAVPLVRHMLRSRTNASANRAELQWALSPAWHPPQTNASCLTLPEASSGAGCASCNDRRVTLGLLYFDEPEVLRSPLTAVTAPPAAPPVTAPPPGPPVTAPLEAPDIVDHLIQNAQDEVSTIPAAPPLIIKLSTPGRDAAPSSDGQARHARARDTRANTSGGGAAHDADAACGSRNSTHCLRAVAACATHFRLQPPSRPPLFSNQPRAHPRVLGDCSPGHCEHAGHGAKHETRSHAGGSRSC